MAGRGADGVGSGRSISVVSRVTLPKSISLLWEQLEAHTPAYLVGGAVRDLFRGEAPHDWDFALRWRPETVQALGESLGYRVIPTGLAFGTVTFLTEAGPVEVTTFRKDGRYADGRHPQRVTFAQTIEEDLSRRDFTMNAMALTFDGQLIDPFGGQEDLDDRIIRAVGEASDRFQEDPLRMWRAVRFTGLGLVLSLGTEYAVQRYRHLLIHVSAERQRDELLKGLDSVHVDRFLRAASRLGVLGVKWPEWEAAVGFDQHNPYHTKTVHEHLIDTASGGSTQLLRLTGLLHDIAKPSCFCWGLDDVGHFYGHEHVGAVYTRSMLERLAFDKKTIDAVCTLIDQHMFPWDEAGKPAIRRMLREHGEETVQHLLELRRMDVIGSGRRWETEEAVRAKVQAVMEEVLVAKRTLAISGNDVMRVLGILPGPLVGQYLVRLQTWVDEDPARNNQDLLVQQLHMWRD